MFLGYQRTTDGNIALVQVVSVYGRCFTAFASPQNENTEPETVREQTPPKISYHRIRDRIASFSLLAVRSVRDKQMVSRFGYPR
jgi:hypothetical protein